MRLIFVSLHLRPIIGQAYDVSDIEIIEELVAQLSHFSFGTIWFDLQIFTWLEPFSECLVMESRNHFYDAVTFAYQVRKQSTSTHWHWTIFLRTINLKVWRCFKVVHNYQITYLDSVYSSVLLYCYLILTDHMFLCHIFVLELLSSLELLKTS